METFYPAVGEDDTEVLRRKMARDINAESRTREALEEEHGEVWDCKTLGRDFEVLGFADPFVVVVRKEDKVIGSLMFQHCPRLYWGFAPA